MKTFSKIVSIAMAMLFIGTTAKAQCFEQCQAMSGKLQEIHVLTSQAQGTAQQVYTFASNGNFNQMIDRMARLSNEMGQISRSTNELITLPGMDRLSIAYVQPLKVEMEALVIIHLSVASGGSTTQIGNAAAILRERLLEYRGRVDEKRVAICCASV